MRYQFTDGADSVFTALTLELDESLNEQVGGEAQRAKYNQYNKTDDIHDVVLAYDGDTAVACAGFKPFDAESAEVKRVFVRAAYRGKGVGREMMRLLELRAKERGLRFLVLETGVKLTAARAMYEKLGYVYIPNYGPYAGMDTSVCMKKTL